MSDYVAENDALAFSFTQLKVTTNPDRQYAFKYYKINYKIVCECVTSA